MGISAIIAGGRNFNDYELLKTTLDKIRKNMDISEIVSGHCVGADQLGERYANENNVPLRIISADWETYAKEAGGIRDQQMCLNADYLIAFWNGKSKGTNHLISTAKKKGIPYKVIEYEENKDG